MTAWDEPIGTSMCWMRNEQRQNAMKRLPILMMVVLTAMLGACGHEPTFDESLMVGRWCAGTEYYRYDANHRGATWDEGDDVSEAEAQSFTWQLDGDQLTVVHLMEMGGQIPKTYQMVELNERTMTYKDDYYKTYTYTRVR